MTERARAVTEGNTAIHVDSRAVSQTTGLAKAFPNTPEEKQAGITFIALQFCSRDITINSKAAVPLVMEVETGSNRTKKGIIEG